VKPVAQRDVEPTKNVVPEHDEGSDGTVTVSNEAGRLWAPAGKSCRFEQDEEANVPATTDASATASSGGLEIRIVPSLPDGSSRVR
jgi:hypothetical protein